MEKFEVFFVTVATLVFVAAVVSSIIPNNHKGEYKKSYGECIQGEQCGKGRRLVMETCIPSKDGDPCEDEDGNKTFEKRRYHEDCETICASHEWEEKRITPCIVSNHTPGFCIKRGTLGKRTWDTECVKKSEYGVNRCSYPEAKDITTSYHHEPDTLIQGKTHEEGKIISHDQTCDDFEDPMCGDWYYVDKKTIRPVSNEDIEIEYSSDCYIFKNGKYVKAGLYDQMKLGISIFETGCVPYHNLGSGSFSHSSEIVFPKFRLDKIPKYCNFENMPCKKDEDISGDNLYNSTDISLLCPESKIGERSFDNFPKKYSIVRSYITNFPKSQIPENNRGLHDFMASSAIIMGMTETGTIYHLSEKMDKLELSCEWKKINNPAHIKRDALNLIFILNRIIDNNHLGCSFAFRRTTKGDYFITQGNDKVKFEKIASSQEEAMNDSYYGRGEFEIKYELADSHLPNSFSMLRSYLITIYSKEEGEVYLCDKDLEKNLSLYLVYSQN